MIYKKIKYYALFHEKASIEIRRLVQVQCHPMYVISTLIPDFPSIIHFESLFDCQWFRSINKGSSFDSNIKTLLSNMIIYGANLLKSIFEFAK